ncbi:MAG TPA: cupin domain-containing protein [Xanthobacteraceae bacterium]|nr:cupin domain-containing protein [Xanthobacteraceae bacterium]
MADGTILVGSTTGELTPAPIRADWIIDGNPVARNRFLSKSDDGTASSYIWDCTAGRFNWQYDIDETVYILEGSVTIKDNHQPAVHTLTGGDTVFFPAGSSAEWTINRYVRKVAFLRVPLTRRMLFLKKIAGALKRLAGRRHDEDNLHLGSPIALASATDALRSLPVA